MSLSRCRYLYQTKNYKRYCSTIKLSNIINSIGFQSVSVLQKLQSKKGVRQLTLTPLFGIQKSVNFHFLFNLYKKWEIDWKIKSNDQFTWIALIQSG